MARARLRELGYSVGYLPTGPLNAITDVPGVLVGQTTILADTPQIARTGVTLIMPQREIWRRHLFAGAYTLNGFGEMTGVHWIHESGLLASPIAITNTYSVGTVSDALFAHAHEHGYGEAAMPVVAETWDGWLNDIGAFHVRREHVEAALAAASAGPVAEGNVGGGTGMICHGFKGGIGTASRVVELGPQKRPATLGVLVQANYGARRDLRIDGVPVGMAISPEEVPLPWGPPPSSSSIIVIVATDAPLLPIQCRRLARRVSGGLGRVGGFGFNSSGDIFLAFSTATQIVANQSEPHQVAMLPTTQIDPLFTATVEATEEAVVNALCMAETLEGRDGHVAHALPLERLQEVMRR
ncbi:MAG: S58 family peptidase [Oscillochloris sp.]|nr:S58 family peptidase [Oscillochloris sp.]